MDELFLQLGFSIKETKCYRILLEEGQLTASEISKILGESRTNTYMILEQLEKEELVKIDESSAVRKYAAESPDMLRKLIVMKQQEIKKTQNVLNQYLPELQSLYNLNRMKPGVVYLEGLKGLRLVLDDMARSRHEALIIPSQHSPNIPEAWEILQKGVNKRAKLGAKSRIIFPEFVRKSLEVDRLTKQGMTVRFWGSKEYPGEIVVYGNKCVFTTYSPTVINTILTNETIAITLREVFEDIWLQAKP